MGTISAPKLFDQWKLEKLTREMAIGHLLQHLVLLYEENQQLRQNCHKYQIAIDAINISRANLRADVDQLLAHTGLPATSTLPIKRKRGRPRHNS